MELGVYYCPEQNRRQLDIVKYSLDDLVAPNSYHLGTVKLSRPVVKETIITAIGSIGEYHPQALDALKQPLEWFARNTVRTIGPDGLALKLAECLLAEELIPVTLYLMRTNLPTDTLYATPRDADLKSEHCKVMYESKVINTACKSLHFCGNVDLPRSVLNPNIHVMSPSEGKPHVRWKIRRTNRAAR